MKNLFKDPIYDQLNERGVQKYLSMKRKYNFIEETEINHEYYIIKQKEIIYNDKQEIEYYKQNFTFNYQPKKRIKMTKRKNEEKNDELIARENESFIDDTTIIYFKDKRRH